MGVSSEVGRRTAGAAWPEQVGEWPVSRGDLGAGPGAALQLAVHGQPVAAEPDPLEVDRAAVGEVGEPLDHEQGGPVGRVEQVGASAGRR